MSKSDKIQTIVLFILGVGLLGVLVLGQRIQQPQGFTQAPPEIIHTARVYEDGSYTIQYKDGTSETGCNKGGLCND